MWKRIGKTILNVLLFICLVIVSYLTIIRGLFLSEVNAQTLGDISIEDLNHFTKFSNTDIHGLFDDLLKQNNLPIEIIDEIMDSKEPNEVINQYIETFISSTQNGQDIPEIPKEKIEEILEKGIQKYNQKYHANISVAKGKEIVASLIPKLQKILQIVQNNMSFFGWIRFLFHDKVYYSFLILLFLFMMIMAILYRIEFLFSFGGICIFNGIILWLTYFILKLEAFQNIFEFFPFNHQELKHTFFQSSICFLGLGIFLFILYHFLHIYFLKRQKHLDKIIQNE